MASQNIHFPYPSDGRTLTSFEWRPIRYRNIISILKNPFYAGVYAYGKSEKRTTIVDGRARKSYGHRKPMGTWERCLTVAGKRIDETIAVEMLRAVTPMAIEAAEEASAITAPGTIASATIRPFSPSLHRRRRANGHATLNAMQRRCAGISVAPSGVHGAGSASRRSSILLGLGLGGKFQAKSSGWDENRTFLEGDVLEVAGRSGRWVLCHIPAGPRPAPAPAQHYFPTGGVTV